MKNLIKNKRFIAIILLFLTIFSTISPVFAVSGNANFVGGQYGSGIKTTDNAGSTYGMLIRKLINRSTGEQYTVFCAEHGVDFTTDVAYNGNYYTPTDATIKRACKIAYLGWYSKHPNYVIDGGILAESMYNVKLDYVFTQQYIWETLGQSSARFIDSGLQSRYESFRNNINVQIDSMQRQPSFVGQTIELDAGNTITVNDSNGVLASYNSMDRTVEGIRIVHNKGENSLSITVNDDCNVENYRISNATFSSWGMIKDETKDNDTTIYFSFKDGVQNQLYAMHYNDPVSMSLSLKINLLGNLELSKLNTNKDLVDGAKFRVTGPNNFNQLVEVKNGKITLEKIKKGIYSISEESVPERLSIKY